MQEKQSVDNSIIILKLNSYKKYSLLHFIRIFKNNKIQERKISKKNWIHTKNFNFKKFFNLKSKFLEN